MPDGGADTNARLELDADIMHRDNMPLVRPDTIMRDVLITMTSGGFGVAGVTDEGGALVGIITDGDLRRHMRPDLLNAKVDDVMTRSPKTVRPDQLVSETLELLNSMKITALFVVDAGQPVGIVHIHDLLRAGAA